MERVPVHSPLTSRYFGSFQMDRGEEGKRKVDNASGDRGDLGSKISGPPAGEDDEIEAIGSLIAAKRKRPQAEERDDSRHKEAVLQVLCGGSASEGEGVSKLKRRDHFTCITCVALGFHDVFTKRNSEIKVKGDLNYNELFIKFALSMLARAYKRNYYKAGVNSETPRIHPTFDFPGDGDPPHNGKHLSSTCRIDRILSDFDSEFCLVLDGSQPNSRKAGLHLSLTRNHHLSKKMSLALLSNLVKRLNNLKASFQVQEKPFKSQRVGFKVPLKPFSIFLDYDSVLILENTCLNSKNAKVNGGVFAAIQVHNASKKTYLDPIIEVINQACADLGIQPLHSEQTLLHISLFYIKRSEMYLKKTPNQRGNHMLQVHSLKQEFLPSALLTPSLSDLPGSNIIWVDHLVFKLGIYEYYLLFDS